MADTTEGVFGAAALVAGNMVGGGILAIPTVCAGPGFYPAAALTICLWAANVGTGLLLGEVAAAAVRRGDEDVSLRALSRDALGESGAQLTSAFFVITNLMLMGAYVAAGGDALIQHERGRLRRPPRAFFLAATPLLAGAPSVLADAANSRVGLVVAMVGALGALLVVAAPEVDPSLLAQPGPRARTRRCADDGGADLAGRAGLPERRAHHRQALQGRHGEDPRVRGSGLRGAGGGVHRLLRVGPGPARRGRGAGRTARRGARACPTSCAARRAPRSPSSR